LASISKNSKSHANSAGAFVGMEATDGEEEGFLVELCVGLEVRGLSVGSGVGPGVGRRVRGDSVGSGVGSGVGARVRGTAVG
jgi:hypothetical protein